MSNQTKGGPIALVVGGLVMIILVILVAHVMPSRMPADPFEGDEPREVTLEVVWDVEGESGPEQFITWRIGGEGDELRTFGQTGEGFGGWFWAHVSTGHQGEPVLVRAVPSEPGRVECFIFIDDVLAYDHSSDKPTGCEAKGPIP